MHFLSSVIICKGEIHHCHLIVYTLLLLSLCILGEKSCWALQAFPKQNTCTTLKVLMKVMNTAANAKYV